MYRESERVVSRVSMVVRAACNRSPVPQSTDNDSLAPPSTRQHRLVEAACIYSDDEEAATVLRAVVAASSAS